MAIILDFSCYWKFNPQLTLSYFVFFFFFASSWSSPSPGEKTWGGDGVPPPSNTSSASLSRSFGHSCSHKQLWSKKGVWVCVMEDYRAQEMEQEACPPLVKHEQHFLLLWGTEISFLFLIFFPWTHKVETGKSWKHTESGYRHLAQSGLKTGWNIQRLCQPSRNCVTLKIVIIKYMWLW